jgi:hypothetical protein
MCKSRVGVPILWKLIRLNQILPRDCSVNTGISPSGLNFSSDASKNRELYFYKYLKFLYYCIRLLWGIIFLRSLTGYRSTEKIQGMKT